jgi:tRNA(adenine34) deaminase
MQDRTSIPFHERFMRAALAEAEAAAERGDTAAGSVVTYRNEIIAASGNRIASASNPLAHAEITAINGALAKIGHERLRESTLYATMEPCPMCGWAIHLARIGTVVLGAPIHALGRTDLGSYSLDRLARWTGQPITIVSGVLEQECIAFRRAWQERTRRLV